MAQQARKLCFVTVGATASFHFLLKSILDPGFLSALSQHDYTDLLIQFGKDGQPLFDEFAAKYPPGDLNRHDITVHGFDFNQAGLDNEMRLAQAKPAENRSSGLVISHAGNYRTPILNLRLELNGIHRFWQHFSGTEIRCSTCRGAQSYSSGQSPRRTCRSTPG
jgi:UDP-N-acetylglucosamine transferase subunit ALG13